MKKKLISFLLLIFAITLIFPQDIVLASEKSYSPFYAEILNELGLLLGSDGNLNLEGDVTRAQGAVMIVRFLGKESEAKAKKYPHPFKDVPAWASPYVGYCYNNGITSGISATQYGSNLNMTQDQYTTFILRALGYKDTEGDFSVPAAIKKAAEIGLLSVDEANRLSSSPGFIRGQMALISYKALFANIKGKNTNLLNRLLNESAVDRETVDKSGLLETVKCEINKKPYSDILQPALYGRTMYNIADIFRTAGWKSVLTGNNITLTKGNDTLTLKAGDTNFVYNKENYKLGVPIAFVNNKVYSSFELFNHVLGAESEFDESNNTYKIRVNSDAGIIRISYKDINDLKARLIKDLNNEINKIIISTSNTRMDTKVFKDTILNVLSEKGINCYHILWRTEIGNDTLNFTCEIDYPKEQISAGSEDTNVVQVNSEDELIRLILENLKNLNYGAFYFIPTSRYQVLSFENLKEVVGKAGRYAAINFSDGYISGYSSIDNKITKYYIDFNMKYPKIEARFISSEINDAAETLIRNLIKPGMSELEKVKAFHDYIIQNARYDYHNEERDTIDAISYTPYGILKLGIGVCESYARAMKVLLDRAGIENILISNSSHMWNIVKVNGKYRHFDVTWDDPVPDQGSKVQYTYYNLTDAQMLKSRTWNTAEYPACN